MQQFFNRVILERMNAVLSVSALARFRYSDLKEAARGCGGRVCYANSIVRRSDVEVCGDRCASPKSHPFQKIV